MLDLDLVDRKVFAYVASKMFMQEIISKTNNFFKYSN